MLWKEDIWGKLRRLGEHSGSFALEVGSGGTVFVASLAVFQVIGRGLGVSSSTRLRGVALGATAFVVSAHGAHFSAQLVRNGIERGSWFSNNRKSMPTAEAVRNVLLTAVAFKLGGGRLRSLMPSDISNIGAFARLHLPATLEYANGGERAVINAYGKIFGCHTCGLRSSSIPYHADHQPPVKYVKQMNEAFWRRALARNVVQRFYPQCQPCSNVQGQTVRVDGTYLRLHASALRPYHAAGAVAIGLVSAHRGAYAKLEKDICDVYSSCSELETFRQVRNYFGKVWKDAAEQPAIQSTMATLRTKKEEISHEMGGMIDKTRGTFNRNSEIVADTVAQGSDLGKAAGTASKVAIAVSETVLAKPTPEKLRDQLDRLRHREDEVMAQCLVLSKKAGSGLASKPDSISDAVTQQLEARVESIVNGDRRLLQSVWEELGIATRSISASTRLSILRLELKKIRQKKQKIKDQLKQAT